MNIRNKKNSMYNIQIYSIRTIKAYIISISIESVQSLHVVSVCGMECACASAYVCV